MLWFVLDGVCKDKYNAKVRKIIVIVKLLCHFCLG